MARTKRISRWVVHLVSAYKGMCLFVISFLSKPKIKPFLPSGGTRTKLMELEPHWWRLSKLLQVLSSVNNSGQADDVFRPLSLSLTRKHLHRSPQGGGGIKIQSPFSHRSWLLRPNSSSLTRSKPNSLREVRIAWARAVFGGGNGYRLGDVNRARVLSTEAVFDSPCTD